MAVVVAPSPNWPGYDMTEVFAPLFLGTVVSLVLTGITIMQAYIFFPSKDRMFLQIIAGGMIVFDLISTGLIAEGVYSYVVPNFGSMIPLGNLNPSLAAECCMSVFIVFVSHLFFAFQIFSVLPHGPAKYVVPGIVAFFGTVSFAGAIGCVITMFTQSHNILTDRSYQFSVFVGIAKGAAAVADIIATGALCLFIKAAHASTGFSKTNSMLKRLIGYILQRGILVTLIQVAFLVIFFTTSTKFAWLALHVNVTRIYANTFFAMLNGRASLKETTYNFNTISGGKSGTYNNSTNTKELQFVAAPKASLDDKVVPGIVIGRTTEYSTDA
ncbi:hypothetical protein DFH07DRAFT_575533 [Mycena maculata]|uniref:DUF6534 domain-containing protein n=1 Tax=Mycena maculata TaxID=230809 RepID=A0AAD7IQS5_9AGAR|nr:hypothetical protein DFH07DRAFT_575533 [Mycena maculata]